MQQRFYGNISYILGVNLGEKWREYALRHWQVKGEHKPNTIGFHLLLLDGIFVECFGVVEEAGHKFIAKLLEFLAIDIGGHHLLTNLLLFKADTRFSSLLSV